MGHKKSDADDRCRRIAAEQHGLVGREEAYDAGHDSRSVSRRVRSGEWSEVFPDAFLIGGGDPEWLQWLAGACISSGGAAFRRSAAALHRFPGIRRKELEVLTTARPRPLTSVDVHHTCYLPDEDITVVEGIATTSPARTFFDICGICGFREARGMALTLLEDDVMTPSELHDVWERTARNGRPGSAVTRRVIATLGMEEVLPASYLEDRALEVIKNAGFPLPVRQFEIRGSGVFLGRVDLAYPPLWIGVEADGWDAHRSKTRFLDDRARQNGLVSHGWIILRFTARDAQRPLRFLTELERTIARRAREIEAGIFPAA